MVIILNNGISIQYPRTEYIELNQKIKDYILKQVKDFMEIAASDIQEKQIYTLDISHDEYSYKNIRSFVLYTSTYTGGAHPNQGIWTCVYDASKNEFVTISDLVLKNASILDILSRESRKILINNKGIVNKDMLLEGTMPNASNFSNFVFTQQGLLLYFLPYQVAPYSSGSFKIVIPYSCFDNQL